MFAAAHAPTSMRRLALVALCLTPLLQACGRSDPAPPTAPVGDGLSFVDLTPAPRSHFVPIDVRRIAASATEVLDSLTVNTRTVFLKIDTQRVGVSVRLAEDGRTIEMTPLEPLRRQEIYTVELSTAIATRAGRSLSSPLLWQFTTSILVRPVVVHPPPGTTVLARRDRLEWSGNVSAATGGVYVLRWAADYPTVANGGGDVMYTGTSNVFLPDEELPTESVFWAVDAQLPGAPALSSAVGELRSQSYGEPSPVDVAIARRAVAFDVVTTRPRCEQEFSAGPGSYAVIDLSYASTSVDVRSASISVTIAAPGNLPPDLTLTLYGLTADWLCSPSGVFTVPSLHTSLGALSEGTREGRRVTFSSGRLASHMHWLLRSGRRLQYAIRSNHPISMAQPGTVDGPTVTLTVSPRQ